MTKVLLIATPSDPAVLPSIRDTLGAEFPVRVEGGSVIATITTENVTETKLKAIESDWAEILGYHGVVSVEARRATDGWMARLLAAAGGGALGLVGAWGVTRAMR